MHYGLLAVTFLSVNLDFFFILLFLLRQYRLTQVLIGYLIGVLLLVTASFAAGKVLAAILPEWLLGLLGLLPIWLAFRADDDEANADHLNKMPWLSVMLTYLSVCAGCNLAIFLPVLAGVALPDFGLTLLFIAGLTVLVVLLIHQIAELPIVTRVMDRFGAPLMKACYVLIGLYVFWDSGLIHHVRGWL